MSSKTRILFVDDDSHVLSGLKRMLFDREDRWQMQFENSARQALAEFDRQPFDVVVTDMRMPEMDGAELLVRIQQRRPRTVRIILSGQADKESVLRVIGPSHRFLPKPCDCRLLQETIDQSSQLHARLESINVHSLVESQTVLPWLPQLYDLLIHEIHSPEFAEHIAALIAQDQCLTDQLLQIVNSALLGRATRFSKPLDVVKTIGIDRLRPLVLSAGIFSHFPALPGAGDHNERFIHHSATVSRLAQAIVEREMPGNADAAGIALLAGLTHDIGKLALAQNYHDQYAHLVETAERTGDSICSLEHAAFGCDHSAIAAYLMSLWGLPDNVVEVVAYHHRPSLSGDRRFSPTTAVHVANALDNAHRHAQHSTSSSELPAQLDMSYLERIGVAHKLPRWRELMPTNQHSWFYPAMVEASLSPTESALSIGLPSLYE